MKRERSAEKINISLEFLPGPDDPDDIINITFSSWRSFNWSCNLSVGKLKYTYIDLFPGNSFFNMVNLSLVVLSGY